MAEPGLPNQRRSAWRTSSGRRSAVLAGGVVGLLLLGLVIWLIVGDDDEASTGARSGSSSDTSTTSSAAASANASSASPTKSGKSRTTRKANKSTAAETAPIAPDATFHNTCSYVLGDSTEKPRTGFRFLAKSRVENTGNTGIEVEVQASWTQGQAEAVTEIQRVQVDEGESTTVNISVPVTRKEIDLIRLDVGTGPNCRVESSIVSTY